MRLTPGRVACLAVACAASGSLLLAATPASASQLPYQDTAVSTWSPNGAVYAMVQSHGVIYIGGSFKTLTNPSTGVTVKRDRLAALSATTGVLVKNWHPRVNGTVRALAASHDGSTVYVGGQFTMTNRKHHRFIVALNKKGSIRKHWRAKANNTVRTLLIADNRVYLGGDFDHIDGVIDRGLGAVSETTGTRIASFKGSAEYGPVYTMTLSVTRKSLVIGGSFKQVDAVARPHLASVGLKTGALHRWNPTGICNGCDILTVLTHGHYVYAGRSGPGGAVIAYLTNHKARAWHDYTNGDIQALAYHHGTLYVGGHFKGAVRYSTSREGLAAVHPTTGGVKPFAPDLEPKFPGVWALSATATRLWVGGGFTSVGGTKDARLTAFPTG